MLKIISAVSNDIVTDNRIHKIASSLVDNGYEVTVIGRKFKHSPEPGKKDYAIYRFVLWFNKGPLFYANLNIRFFFHLLRTNYSIVIANDMDTLPACYLAARIRRRKLVFDSHELFSEVPELVHRPVVRKIWQLLEQFLIHRVDAGITVCKSIADLYYKKYGILFCVVKNAAYYRSEHESMHNHEKKHTFTILYQGVLNVSRGIELAIESMRFTKDAQLMIIGKGDRSIELEKMVKELSLEEKIKFTGRVVLEELWEHTSKADIGISLEEDMGLNYRFSLPNKLFDYIQARLPVIVSDLPEMAELVKIYNIGKILKIRTPENLANVIMDLRKELEQSDHYKLKLEQAARMLCWEKEKDELIRIFRQLSVPSADKTS